MNNLEGYKRALSVSIAFGSDTTIWLADKIIAERLSGIVEQFDEIWVKVKAPLLIDIAIVVSDIPGLVFRTYSARFIVHWWEG